MKLNPVEVVAVGAAVLFLVENLRLRVQGRFLSALLNNNGNLRSLRLMQSMGAALKQAWPNPGEQSNDSMQRLAPIWRKVGCFST